MGGESGDSTNSKLASSAGDADQGQSEDLVAVNVRCSNGTKFTVRTALESTVQAFKALLAQNCDVPAEQQRLIYKGRILKDDQTLVSYGLQADHTVHMVRGFAPTSATPGSAPTPAPAATASQNAAPGVTRGVGSTEGGPFGGAGIGSPLFPGLGFNALGGGTGGSANLFGTGLPEFEQVQQQLTQNPNMMRDIMNMPAIQSMMNNPELMRSLIMSNPQMRDIIDRNPELGHVLNDPSVLRQTLEAARNPELMREMMRNTDRAMSNIEASPEGFNMLRRMYENVQEPFLSASTMGTNTGNNPNPNPFAALLANQGGTQTRDASNNSSTTGTETTPGLTVPNSNPLPNPWSNNTGGTQTNTPARLVPAPGDPRATGLAGLGGLGLPGMEQLMGGGMPDAANLNQLMQNPAMSQMMQNLLSNPEYMNQMLTLQQSLLSQLNRQQTTPDSAQTGTTPGAPNAANLELLMNMFGGLGAGGLSTPNQPDVPPEELYATQLSQLQEMGFFDTQENIQALRATAGNVHAAVERLLGNLGQ
ncbi:Ubiquitin domain-containing protein DSK2b [Linum grandiflorum]